MSGLNHSDTPLSELKLIRLKWSRASPGKYTINVVFHVRC